MHMKKAVKNVTAADTLNVNMAIYTKTGDKGETSLYGGVRVPKNDKRVEAYGSVDELTSFVGLVLPDVEKQDQKLLTDIQKYLYKIMAFLSGASMDFSAFPKEIKKHEHYIDKESSTLPKLRRFILPQGTKISTLFHIIRSVCRRAERTAVPLQKSPKENGDFEIILQYMNRLSDLFFIMARKYNKGKEIEAY